MSPKGVILAVLPLLFAQPALAQYAVIVTACGSPSSQLTPGGTAKATVDLNGLLCVSTAGGAGSLAAEPTPPQEGQPPAGTPQ